jgi:hypothetical protein
MNYKAALVRDALRQNYLDRDGRAYDGEVVDRMDDAFSRRDLAAYQRAFSEYLFDPEIKIVFFTDSKRSSPACNHHWGQYPHCSCTDTNWWEEVTCNCRNGKYHMALHRALYTILSVENRNNRGWGFPDDLSLSYMEFELAKLGVTNVEDYAIIEWLNQLPIPLMRDWEFLHVEYKGTHVNCPQCEAIFLYNYGPYQSCLDTMESRRRLPRPFKEELLRHIMQPNNVHKLPALGLV